MPTTELTIDAALGVAIPSRNARGRIARLGPVLDVILASHEYPPILEQLLAEALTLTALLGSLLKEPKGQLTLQAQTEGGIIDLLVCDYLGGELRGYVRCDRERLADASKSPTLQELFGKGYLAITFDQPVANERYQASCRWRARTWPRPPKATLPSRSRFRAWCGCPLTSATTIGLLADCCFSTFQRGRKGVSACIRGSTIQIGRILRSSAAQ